MSRIYVASLSDYNSGRLFGKWLDLVDYADAEDVNSAIVEMLDESEEPGAEEFAIHDYEGFAGFKIGEYDRLEDVFKLHEALEELEYDAVPFVLWAENQGYSPLDAVDNVESFREAFIGQTNVSDYAYEYVQDCVFTPETPEMLKNYFNYEAFARDLVLGGDIYELTAPDFGSTYLFHSA